MKDSKKREIYIKEQEDAQGVRRSHSKELIVKKSLNKLRLVKILLIVCIPLVYFLYSPILILFVAAYAILFVAAYVIEKNANDGLPKRLHIKVFRLDSMLAFILIIIAITLAIIPYFSNSQKQGSFVGQSPEQLESNLRERGLSEKEIKDIKQKVTAKIGNPRSKNLIISLGSLSAGEWVAFKKQAAGSAPKMDEPIVIKAPDSMNNGNGGNLKLRMPTSGGSVATFKDRVPMNDVFSQVASAITAILLGIVIITGLVSLPSLKKARGG